MLVENTGTRILDSGGAYGRNWERVRGKTLEDFKNTPVVTYEVDLSPYPFEWRGKRERKENIGKLTACINPTISVFHFLRKRLDFEPDFQAHLEAFAAQESQKDESWFGVVENWLDSLNGKYLDWNARAICDEDGDGPDLIKVRGPDTKQPQTVNSYNHECRLDQTIQFTMFTLTGDAHSRDGQVYIALFVYGGCDVRGGYTRPKIFSVCTSEWTSILDFDRVNIDGGCSDRSADLPDWFCIRWDSLGHPDHDGRDAIKRLPGVEAKWLGRKLEDFPAVLLETGQPVPDKRGIAYVAKNTKTAYCSFTGTAITAWTYEE